MEPFRQGKSSLDRILWMMIFIGMVVSALGGPFSPGSFFLMPAPLIILNVLISPLTAMTLILGAAILFAAEQGVMNGLSFFLLIGIFSQLQGFMIRRVSRVSRALFFSMMFVLSATLLLIFLDGLFAGHGGTALLTTLGKNLEAALKNSAYTRNLTALDVSGFFPFFVLYLVFIFIASNFFLARGVLKYKGITVISLGNLSEFQLPPRIIEGMFFLIAMGYGVEMAGWTSGHVLMNTLFYLSAFVLMFEGLAICSYFLKRYRLSSLWQTVILTALLLSAGPIGLALAGFFDVLMDLRKQRRTGGNQG